MTAFALSQILTCLAIVSDIASFQFKDRRKIVACLCISGALLATHFFLLEQWTAAGLSALATARYFWSIFSTSRKLVYLFTLVILIVFFATYNGILSILACAASLLGTIAAFNARDLILRRFMIIATIFWIIHNTILGSPAAIAIEVIFLGSNLIGYYRYYIRDSWQKKVLLGDDSKG